MVVALLQWQPVRCCHGEMSLNPQNRLVLAVTWPDRTSQAGVTLHTMQAAYSRSLHYALVSLALPLVHPVSKTHWATRRHQHSLLTASSCTTSQVMPMLFKSCCMVSIQFFCGLPGFLFVPLIFQCTACLGSLLSSIHTTCPSHLSLLSFMIRSIFSSCVCTLTLYNQSMVYWVLQHEIKLN